LRGVLLHHIIKMAALFGVRIFPEWGILGAAVATGFVFFLFAVSFWRYRQGHWKNVRVIEDGVGK
jgi:Na+-driven multidrug efflux pump